MNYNQNKRPQCKNCFGNDFAIYLCFYCCTNCGAQLEDVIDNEVGDYDQHYYPRQDGENLSKREMELLILYKKLSDNKILRKCNRNALKMACEYIYSL